MATPFSIVLPTYLRESFLKRSISSVLNQIFTDFELLVIDDAASQVTKKVIESFSDSRIIYIPKAARGGVSAARNTGIRLAQGKYISLLDDDDEYLPLFLQKTFDVMETLPHAGFCWCSIRRVFENANSEIVEKD